MPHYKIVDYKHPTSGELARLLLNYVEVEFEDVQVEELEEVLAAEEGSPFGILPVLEVDGEVVAQQQGICRYIAREHGLAGKDNKESAICDMIMEGLGRMFGKLREGSFSKLTPEEQKIIVDLTMKEDVPKFLQRYEKVLRKKSDKGFSYLVGNEITWCDLGVALTFAAMKYRNPNLLDSYPLVLDLVKRISEISAVQQFLKARHAVE